MQMRMVGGFVIVAAAVLLAASGLVSAGSKRPLADPTETVGVFLPYVGRNEEPEPTQEPEVSDLKISWINPRGTDEDVIIDNNGAAPQDMTGWRLHSVIGNQWYDFPAGEILWSGAYVHSGPDADCGGLVPWSVRLVPRSCLVWTTEYIWDDAGDKAVLYDAAGQVVDEFCYGTGCP